jgi:hypothetical protein
MKMAGVPEMTGCCASAVGATMKAAATAASAMRIFTFLLL